MPKPLNHNNREIAGMATLAVAAGRSPAHRTVLLGAGASVASGVPSWLGVCEQIVKKFRLRKKGASDAIDLVRDYFRKSPADSHERFWSLYPELSGSEPSAGYAHLANLVRQGFIDLIITTNWDSLTEVALSRVMRPDQYRVLVRGEMQDDMIARAIRVSNLPKILKLHGDLSARLLHVVDHEMPSLGPDLQSAILEVTGTELLIVGSGLEDPDLFGLFTSQALRASIYFVNPEKPRRGSAANAILRGNRHRVIVGEEGHFDSFFTALDLSIQRNLLSGADWKGIEVQKEMLAALERGAASVSYLTVARYVDDFARKIKALQPDMLAIVDDRKAPGGTEIRRRLANTEIGKLPQIAVHIDSDMNNRVIRRRAVVEGAVPNMEPIRIVLVDSVSFSGNTLKIAALAVKKVFPMAAVEVAALVVSRQLVERATLGREGWLSSLTHQLVTDRHDITFPWGSTYSTDLLDRSIGYVQPPRRVKIFRRPWGAGEIFADQENCSVRVLTIEAGQRLSFQRHLCRDEMFVALDDEIGFDISGHDFGEDEIDPFDVRIDAVALSRGDYLLVPRGIWHRARAQRTQVRLLEIGLGIYDEERDIERLLDDYGRGRWDTL